MSTSKTMTTREFLNAVIKGEVTDKEIAKASELLAALDAKNEKRKSTDSKEKKEAAARREQVLHFLRENEGAFTRGQIAENIGMDATKVTGACTRLVTEGLVVKSKVKVDKTEKVAYSIA